VRSTFVGVDIVRERVNCFGIPVIPLQRDLGVDPVALALHVDRLLVDRALVLVQMLHERNDAAVVLKLMALGLPFVVEGDQNAGVEEGELAKTLRKRVEAELDGFENVLVGRERDFGAALLGGASDIEVGLRRTTRILLFEYLPVSPDFEVEFL
jgi:hypothetical protein